VSRELNSFNNGLSAIIRLYTWVNESESGISKNVDHSPTDDGSRDTVHAQ